MFPSPGIFGCPDESKLDLPSLERRHSIAVDQRDLSPGMLVHSIDAACGDEVAGLDDKVLHAKQYTRKEGRSEYQKPRRVLSGLLRTENVPRKRIAATGLSGFRTPGIWRIQQGDTHGDTVSPSCIPMAFSEKHQQINELAEPLFCVCNPDSPSRHPPRAQSSIVPPQCVILFQRFSVFPRVTSSSWLSARWMLSFVHRVHWIQGDVPRPEIAPATDPFTRL
jgi:hypothetical protein